MASYSASSSAPAIVALLDSLEPQERARLDFSTRLWDQTALVCEKSRMAKHSTKAMAAFYGELAKIERSYAASLQKLASNPDFGAGLEANENKAPLVSNIIRAWNTIKADVIGRSRAHAQFADIAANKIEFLLAELRKKLSAKKEALETGITDSSTKLKQSQESHIKLKARHEKLAVELASKGPSKNLTEVEVSMAFDAVTNAQLLEFKMQNAHYRVVSENLGKLQELELERVASTRSILLLARQHQSTLERKYMLTEPAQYEAIQRIEPVAEIMPWVEAHASKNPCPWASAKAVQVAAPAAAASSSSSSSAPPIHNRPPTGAALAGGAAARTAPRSAQRGAGAGASHRSPSPSSPPTASAPGNAADRKLRSSRHNSLLLSPEAVKLIASGSPILAALATPPASAASALPPQLSLKDLPFPTIGLPKRIEPLPSFSWMPSARSLFPTANPATLPDISSLALSGMEYNKLCYEQLLLSTNCLADVAKQEHRETLLAVVRVQLHIPQSEHDLLTKVLAVEQGVLMNSPSHLAAAEQRSAAVRQRAAAAAAGGAGDASATLSPPPASSVPAPHVAESMMYVNYRLALLRSVKSGRFPTLTAYRNWFGRQVHAVWLAILWTMQAQVIQAASPSNPANVVAPSAAAAASGVAAGTTISLAAFKHTLQQVQLLGFSLSSKIDTKIFTLGDHLGSGAHNDMLAQISELESTLRAFPVPFQSVVAEALQYPQLMLNKVYKHLIHVSCIAGGDEFGRPLLRDQKDGGDGSASDSDTSDIDDDTISLHTSYLSVIASLSSVRTQWKIPEFYHQYSLLALILHVAYYQALEYDGKLLDADCMLEGESCILPLLAHVSNAICGHLRPELAAITAASPRDQKIKPEQLDVDENAFLCFALRNVGYALSDFQRFASGPVSVCFQFYHDICSWLGVKDVAARCEAFLRISTTNFYQTLIPTEQVLIMPSFSAGSSAAPSTPRKGDRDGSSSSTAQIQITPKKPANWSGDEWRTFSQSLCAFIVDQIEDFYPAFFKNKALKHTLARGKKSVLMDEDDEAASVASSPSGAKKNSAEACILQLLRCFAQDVAALNADRKSRDAGMDDTLMHLVSALVRIQTQLMDSGFAEFWTGQAVKAEIATVFPNLAELCGAAINRWLDVQKIKVQGISERCVSTDTWSSVDPDGGLKYSHSVPDLYNFLNTMHDAFWVHARSLAGYGLSESLESMVAMLNATLVQYGAYIVESCGLSMMPQIFPTKDVKLKQAKLVPTDKDKAKAFVSGLFKKMSSKDKEKEGAMSPNEEEPVAPDLLQKGLVIQTMQSLCVRLCCIEAAIDFSADLSQSLQTQAAAFVTDFPIVAPETGSSSSGGKGDHSREAEQAARAARRWQEWNGCFAPPVKLPSMESGRNAFTEAVDQMRDQIEQLAEGVGVSLVYVEWRSTWLTKLYAPQPLESNRVRAGDLENKVEESMPIVHECLTRTLFPVVAKHIFKQLMTAIQYVMLYGRRGIQEEQVKSIITGDIAQLMDIFGKVVSARDLERSTKDIQELCQVMEIPTDDLISMYNSNKCPLPIPIMARIIAARSGKNAQKLIDKIRGK